MKAKTEDEKLNDIAEEISGNTLAINELEIKVNNLDESVDEVIKMLKITTNEISYVKQEVNKLR